MYSVYTIIYVYISYIILTPHTSPPKNPNAKRTAEKLGKAGGDSSPVDCHTKLKRWIMAKVNDVADAKIPGRHKRNLWWRRNVKKDVEQTVESCECCKRYLSVVFFRNWLVLKPCWKICSVYSDHLVVENPNKSSQRNVHLFITTHTFEKQQAAKENLGAYSNLERKPSLKMLNNAMLFIQQPSSSNHPKKLTPSMFFHPPQRKTLTPQPKV